MLTVIFGCCLFSCCYIGRRFWPDDGFYAPIEFSPIELEEIRLNRANDIEADLQQKIESYKVIISHEWFSC